MKKIIFTVQLKITVMKKDWLKLVCYNVHHASSSLTRIPYPSDEDETGDIFITGNTGSPATSFPIHPLSTTLFNYSTLLGPSDAFIAKFDKIYNLQWCTYYSGSDEDWGSDVAINNNGDVYVSGGTYSTDLTMHQSPCQPFYDGTNAATIMALDGFVLRFDADGNNIYSTYLGGINGEAINAISCQKNGHNIVVVGATSSTDAQDFPLHDFNPNSNFDYYQPKHPKTTHPFVTNFLDASSCRLAGHGNETIPTNEYETQSTTISVFPIPSDGIVSFVSNNKIERIQIMDMMGKTVLLQKGLYVNMYNCDLSKYPEGIYISEIFAAGSYYWFKIIISH